MHSFKKPIVEYISHVVRESLLNNEKAYCTPLGDAITSYSQVNELPDVTIRQMVARKLRPNNTQEYASSMIASTRRYTLDGTRVTNDGWHTYMFPRFAIMIEMCQCFHSLATDYATLEELSYLPLVCWGTDKRPGTMMNRLG